MKAPEATAALISSLRHLEGRNRELAVAGLTRDSSRILATLEAIESGNVPRDIFSREKSDALKNSTNPEVRSRAEIVLK
jgi:hypothetical protein